MGKKPLESRFDVRRKFFSALPTPPPPRGRRVRKWKKVVGHVCLFVFLLVYTAAGGKVFQRLEYLGEKETQREIRANLAKGRSSLASMYSNCSSSDDYEQTDLFLMRLRNYELLLHNAMSRGIVPWDEESGYHWNYMQAVFFASTVLTTIGYGNYAPQTIAGRVFCIVFALIGIPITLTVIANMGKPFASFVTFTYKKVKKCLPSLRVDRFESGMDSLTGKVVIVLAAMGFLISYISIGGALFSIWEDWSFFEGFYFCFITMTTIGFGDIVPNQTEYMLLCTVYILVGLALTSTIIELVRRQYAQSWKHMKDIRGKLQFLSSSLGDTLKKLSEHAQTLGGTGEEANADLVKDLRDLRRMLNLTKTQLNRCQKISEVDEHSEDFDADSIQKDGYLPGMFALIDVSLWKDIPFIDEISSS